MTNKYIPYAQREGIQDEELITIYNYLERHAKVFEKIDLYTFQLDDKVLEIDIKRRIVYIFGEEKKRIVQLPLRIFTNNVASLYSWIRKEK